MSKKTLLIFIFLISPLLLSANSIKALLLADINDGSIGPSTKIDINNMEAALRDASKNTGLPIDVKILEGNQLNQTNVTNAVTNWNITSTDSVVFYFSGHGYRSANKTTKWPMMYIKGNSGQGIDIQWVIDTINSKNPRMAIIISDSCNNIVNFSSSRSINTRAMRSERKESWKKLFTDFSGRIYASAAIPGQVAWGDNSTGGAFTLKFLASLRGEVTESDANWEDIMKVSTQKIGSGSNTQDPQYELQGNSTPNTPNTPTINPPNNVIPAHEETEEEKKEFCDAFKELYNRILTVKNKMPATFNFNQKELAEYQEFSKSLDRAKGDSTLQSLSNTMQQNLKQRNWASFRLSLFKYESHISLQYQKSCIK